MRCWQMSGSSVEHHQSISSCSCVPAEDRWAPGRTQPTNESTIPGGCQGLLADSQRGSQVAHTTAGEQTGELLRLKVSPGYVYAPLGRHATPVLPAITGDSALVVRTSGRMPVRAAASHMALI